MGEQPLEQVLAQVPVPQVCVGEGGTSPCRRLQYV